MHRLTRLTLATATLIMLLTLSAACRASDSAKEPSDLEAVTVKLSWQDGAQFLGFYIAQERGYYAEEGLAVDIRPATSAGGVAHTPGQVARGEIDFGVGGVAGILAEQEASVAAIAAIYQFSPAALFARDDSGIVTPADLAGRTVAVKGLAWQGIIEKMLDQQGLALDDIEPISASFDMTPFYEGEVEVWAGWLTDEVVMARRRGIGLVVLPCYEYGIRHQDNMIYAGQEMLRSNPERAVRFLRATLRGWQWAVEHPAEAVDEMLERFPEMAAEADFHLSSFQASIPLILPGGVRLGTLDCSAPQFMGEPLPDEFCSDEILNLAREGD